MGSTSECLFDEFFAVTWVALFLTPVACFKMGRPDLYGISSATMDKVTLKLCAIHFGMRNVFWNGIIEFNRIRIALCGRGVITRIFLAKKGLK